MLYRRAPTPAAPLELTRLTYDTGLTTDPSISADGKLVAYASDRSGEGHMDIWVQLENQPQPARLTRHAADDWQPSISPDGSRIAFRSERDGGGVYVVGALGGEERKIADRGLLPRFSPDGSQIAYLEDAAFAPRGLKMFLLRAEGGPPRPFQPDFGVRPPPGSMGPLWSPDGRFLLFAGVNVREQGRPDWWVAPVDGGPAVSTGAASLPRIGFVQIPSAWVGSNVLVAAGATMEGVNLHRVRISPGDFKVTGPLEPLTSGTGVSYLASVAADGRTTRQSRRPSEGTSAELERREDGTMGGWRRFGRPTRSRACRAGRASPAFGGRARPVGSLVVRQGRPGRAAARRPAGRGSMASSRPTAR